MKLMHATAKLAEVGLGVLSSAASTRVKNLFLAGLLAAASSWAATQAGHVVGWGGYCCWPGFPGKVPADLGEVVAISAGSTANLAIRPDGTVVLWTVPEGETLPQYQPVPEAAHGAVAIHAVQGYYMAVKPDGTLVAWGPTLEQYPEYNQPPPVTSGIRAVSGLVNSYLLGLRTDGTVIAWGTAAPQAPVPPGLSGVTAIAAGTYFGVALKSDGALVTWGTIPPAPLQLQDPNTAHVIAIAAGDKHAVALRADGTVVAWGDNSWGQLDVPPGLSGVVAVAAGAFHTVALRADGTVVCWGLNVLGQCTPPPGLANVVAISANAVHSLAIVAPPTPRQIKTQVRDDLIALRATATSDLAKFDAAINYLNKALEPSRWLDDSHPKPGKAGDGVFNNEKNAVSQMLALVAKYPAVQPLIDTLVRADRLIAEIAIQEAIARNGNPTKIATAQSYLAKGDADVAAGKPASAIDDYKNAWKAAVGA